MGSWRRGNEAWFLLSLSRMLCNLSGKIVKLTIKLDLLHFLIFGRDHSGLFTSTTYYCAVIKYK